jgi:glycosyltransferase involved in cell wall biosynthesis
MIAIVIPCYKVSAHICDLIGEIGSNVSAIFVIDDCCPEQTGRLVEATITDARVTVIYHATNQGVGGAVLTGYRAAIQAGAEVIVKLDGDGQMNPALLPAFVGPILRGEADYTKGNRFFEIETVQQMPMLRLIGNVGLSFLTKLSSGYWNLFDPTNGYTAISAKVAERLPTEKISRRYFFESDMLFRLNTLRAVVMDIPMFALYAEEQSNLRISRELPRFLFKNLRNLAKRIIYNYLIRNFSYATLELFFGFLFLGFGILFGAVNWIQLSMQGTFASAGTVMLAALPIFIGLQLLLGFVNYDMANVPTIPLQGRLHSDARIYVTSQHELNRQKTKDRVPQ